MISLRDLLFLHTVQPVAKLPCIRAAYPL